MQAAAQRAGFPASKWSPVPTRYPAGGAKQLIRVLTGIEVPHGKLHRLRRAVLQRRHRLRACFAPRTRRTADLAHRHRHRQCRPAPRNYEVAIGTPMTTCSPSPGPKAGHRPLHHGRPDDGLRMPRLDVPVVKAPTASSSASAALFPPPPPEMPCIRCGECAKACPADLQPFELYWFSRSKNFGKAQEYHLFDCIECGCCSLCLPLAHSAGRLLPLRQERNLGARARQGLAADQAPASASSSATSARNARSRKKPRSSPPRPPPPVKSSPPAGADAPARPTAKPRPNPSLPQTDAKKRADRSRHGKSPPAKSPGRPEEHRRAPRAGRAGRHRRHRGPPERRARHPGRRQPPDACRTTRPA
jgi:electron transport complex protein RnfC